MPTFRKGWIEKQFDESFLKIQKQFDEPFLKVLNKNLWRVTK